MNRGLSFFLLLLMAFAHPVNGTLSAQDSDAEKQLSQVRSERRKLNSKFNKLKSEAATDADKKKVAADRAKAELALARKMARYAKKANNDELEIESLSYLTLFFSGEARTTAARAIASQHLKSEHMEIWVRDLAKSKPMVPEVEKWMRAVKEKSPHEKVQAMATYVLMSHMKKLADLSESDREKLVEKHGKAYEKYLASRPEEKCNDAVEWLNELCTGKYGDALAGSDIVSSDLKKELAASRLKIGKVAPDIVGKDIDGVSFKLSDYRGKVVVLDFWGDW